MSKLQGKIAVITGASSGMGRVTAKKFADEGAHVVITGRREKDLQEAASEIGKNVTTVVSDVAKLADIDHLFKVVKEKHGRVDVLFANAGVGLVAPVEMVDEAHFDYHFDINVKGLFFTVQKALPLMKEGGSIILNASIVNFKGMEAFSVYAATKAAVRSFARSMTADLKARKIRVNAISPGPIETPIFGKMGLTQEQIQGFGTAILSQVPMGRFGQSSEIANAALFLASDDSSYITGIDLCVDGGMAQV